MNNFKITFIENITDREATIDIMNEATGRNANGYYGGREGENWFPVESVSGKKLFKSLSGLTRCVKAQQKEISNEFAHVAALKNSKGQFLAFANYENI